MAALAAGRRAFLSCTGVRSRAIQENCSCCPNWKVERVHLDIFGSSFWTCGRGPGGRVGPGEAGRGGAGRGGVGEVARAGMGREGGESGVRLRALTLVIQGIQRGISSLFCHMPQTFSTGTPGTSTVALEGRGSGASGAVRRQGGGTARRERGTPRSAGRAGAGDGWRC